IGFTGYSCAHDATAKSSRANRDRALMTISTNLRRKAEGFKYSSLVTRHSSLISLDARRLDHFRPARDFRFHDARNVGGRAAGSLDAAALKPFFHFGLGEH